MSIWVIRDGKLVQKTGYSDVWEDKRSVFPTPRISRMEPYASPIDGKEITSWGARDRDMKENDAVDPRDLPEKKKQDHGRPDPEQPELPFWR